MGTNAQERIGQFAPEGKGAALSWLSDKISSAQVPEFLSISLADWRCRPVEVLDRCHAAFGFTQVAVRSNAGVEDSSLVSHAGEFCSLLDVSFESLSKALDKVAASMPGHDRDGFLVQRMVQGPRLMGVASTHRIADGAPWYCIELAEHGTASVTEGRATGRQICVARGTANNISALAHNSPEALALALIREVETAAGAFPLEIEFALNETSSRDGWNAYLLQMRPLAAARRWVPVGGRPTRGRLPPLSSLGVPDREPEVAGGRAVLSLMADWNPAELIGAHPRPLALSLFQNLIARGVWWAARSRLGYAPAPGPHVALLRVLRGRPFVDVRRSANSLLPTGLSNELQTRLVDCWMTSLVETPALHDKVEFRVFRTVHDFSLRIETAYEQLSKGERSQWEAALHALTARLLSTGAGSALSLWCAVSAALERDDLNGWSAASLLRRCRVGTLAFAAIARLAFVGEAQLRSAVERGALTSERALALRAAARGVSIPYVSPRDDRYDHLRPGTFDITQPVWSCTGERMAKNHVFQLKDCEAAALGHLLKEAGLHVSAAQWVAFVQQTASAREWSKLVFSRHLSAALEDIASQVAAVGLEREHASWLTLEQLRRGMAADSKMRAISWLSSADWARSVHLQESRLVTGPVLCGPEDRDVADSLGALPNFIGIRSVSGPLLVLDDPAPRDLPQLSGSIVLVRQADPGFDWLFDRGIAGLITEWGGANSHMAIRCAEFGLPAAMGCGASVYGQARAARKATVDPLTQSLWFV